MAIGNQVNLASIFGSVTPSGLVEVEIPLSLNGGAPAASITIPSDMNLEVFRFTVSGQAAGEYRIQRLMGGSWVEIANVVMPGIGSSPLPLLLNIPAGSALRVRGRCLSSAEKLAVLISGYFYRS